MVRVSRLGLRLSSKGSSGGLLQVLDRSGTFSGG